MRIRKTDMVVGVVGNVLNEQSDSQKDTYSCDYINDLVEDDYSTSEIDTGKKWVDGKPIYRKTFFVDGFEAPTTDGDSLIPGIKTIQTGLTDIIYVVNMYGSYYDDNPNNIRHAMFPINFNYIQSLTDDVPSLYQYSWCTYFSGDDLRYPEPNINTLKIVNFQFIHPERMKGYVTLEYTKTPDTSNNS